MRNKDDMQFNQPPLVVTPWFRVDATAPAADRPGEYEVRFSWPGRPIMRIYWDGAKWLRRGKFKPSMSWGDEWRGVQQEEAA